MGEGVGFYSLQQLASRNETARQKARVGIFPWCEMTIRRMWARGEFPKPIVWMNRNMWKRGVIDAYDRFIGQGMAAAEAVVQAEASQALV